MSRMYVLALAGTLVIGQAREIPAESAVEEAVNRAIARVEASTPVYREERSCFSCHHQALPVLALIEARDAGFQINNEELDLQVERTHDHLRRGHDRYLEGKGQGGRADTAGYALWTLEAAAAASDEVTEAVAHYLTVWQRDRIYWPPSGNRPPSEASPYTTTYLALRGLQTYGVDDQQEAIEARVSEATEWLNASSASETEDQVFRLLSLAYVGADQSLIEEQAAELAAGQQQDGGWPQLPESASDAYATATALVALHEAADWKADRPEYQRGIHFLLETQQEDGSWHVVTRSDPIQTYFESGFPHGKDQFISMSATCWAIRALVPAVEQSSEAGEPTGTSPSPSGE